MYSTVVMGLFEGRDITAFSRVHATLRSGRIIFEAQRQ